MKLWLPGLALLAASSSVWADNFRIVQSNTLKLDVWVDNIKDNTPQSWCGPELPLRIVTNGDKTPKVLNDFMPRLGSLLESQCGTLRTVRWQLNDGQGKTLARGTAVKGNEWNPVVTPETAPAQTAATEPPATTDTLPQGRPEDLSPPADRTPWLEFNLQDGCHLRTFWKGGADARALFIPAKDDGICEKGGWLNGRSEVTQMGVAGEEKVAVTFVHGFPIVGINANVDADRLLITSVNNERMVVSDGRAAQSWMILPYNSTQNVWQAQGTVAVEISREQASDEARLRTRLDEVRKVWSAYLAPGATLNILLVEALHPQLRDPAAGAYRAL
ncbi:FIG00553836: hypothetical protein [Cronobacter condimenti 1330]|uniref:Type VI secretion system-associated protein n=1 Tax=Cronobacter condimenti 1330 TaxID=1073999 RepID=K8A128_9ENTR|nr:hypothetical protein [Cronobacter condimenti]ALB61090.1 hypothetical protein AFK62_00465 [Cronobacter condimenti 1330]CCJ73123.1 FIG00553836: hypothetical protein [Cronobacter condimenti 1330]